MAPARSAARARARPSRRAGAARGLRAPPPAAGSSATRGRGRGRSRPALRPRRRRSRALLGDVVLAAAAPRRRVSLISSQFLPASRASRPADAHQRPARRGASRRAAGTRACPCASPRCGSPIGSQRAAVPEQHRAAAVLALGDHALEAAVLDRVVLDLHGEALLGRVEARPLGHGPALEHAVELEAEVVVQAAWRRASGRRTSCPPAVRPPAPRLGRARSRACAGTRAACAPRRRRRSRSSRRRRDCGPRAPRAAQLVEAGAHPGVAVVTASSLHGPRTDPARRTRPDPARDRVAVARGVCARSGSCWRSRARTPHRARRIPPRRPGRS